MHCTNLRTDCTHANPIVGARAWKLEHRLHLQRLQAISSSIDNSKPYMGNIEQQQKGPRKSYQLRSKEKMQAHENFKMLTAIAATMNRPCNLPKPFPGHSLNIGKRRREHWKILKENGQLLQRLEMSKPLVKTAAQDRLDFAAHERRLLMCSYSRRRKGRAHLTTGRQGAEREGKRRDGEEPPSRREGDQTPKHKLKIKCYKVGAAPHEAMTPSAASCPPSACAKSPTAGKKKFDYRWKEFKCYPASRQLWAQPKVFVPKDLPKPLHLATI
ncbi:hypothetical protein Esti_002484 [Eimeria stiedai]